MNLARIFLLSFDSAMAKRIPGFSTFPRDFAVRGARMACGIDSGLAKLTGGATAD